MLVTRDQESISWAIEMQTASTVIMQHKLKLQKLCGNEHKGGIRQLNLYPKLRYFPGFIIRMSEECLNMSPEIQLGLMGRELEGSRISAQHMEALLNS